MALVIFAKLTEIGLPTEDPIGYSADGNIAQTGCVLLLMQDKTYEDTDSLPNYVLLPPVMIIRHRQGEDSQLNLVNRLLTARNEATAIPIKRSFSHYDNESSGIFKHLKSIVACAAPADREKMLRELMSRFEADHFIQVMDRYAALTLLYKLSSDSSLLTPIAKLKELIPERWRNGHAAVEEWYTNMMKELTPVPG